MKTIAFLTFITMTLTSFARTPRLNEEPTTSQKLANRITIALQKNSSEEYIALFPSLVDFHHLMDQNASVYGQYIVDAKAEFGSQYNEKVIPTVKTSFESLIAEGKAKGINWSSIEISGIETLQSPREKEAVSLIVKFKSGAKEYSIQMDNVLVFDSQWKTGTNLRFI